ncbi:MAG: hypothetical protein L3J86_05540 [Thermoplasmata archaeon]|nr:hypothetical protein [Thermoplasmata archaeon]
MSSLEFVTGLAVGLAFAGALYAVLWWMTRRTHPPGLPPGEIAPQVGPPPAAPSESPEPPASPATVVGEVELVVPTALPDANSEPASPSAPEEVPPSAEPMVGHTRRGSSPPATLRLSQRVILHVYAQGVQVPGEVAAPGLCQAGMVEALGIPQAGLAAVLRRLEAAGVLLGEKGHVRGHDRRLKVYRLSPRGIELARELRTRAHRRPPR